MSWFRPREFNVNGHDHHDQDDAEDNSFYFIGACLQKVPVTYRCGDTVECASLYMTGYIGDDQMMIPMVIEPQDIDKLIDALNHWKDRTEPHVHITPNGVEYEVTD